MSDIANIMSDAAINGLKDPDVELTEDNLDISPITGPDGDDPGMVSGGNGTGPDPEGDDPDSGQDGVSISAPTVVEPVNTPRPVKVTPFVKAPKMPMARPAWDSAKQPGMKPPVQDDHDDKQLMAEIRARHGERELLPRINIGAPIHLVVDQIDKAIARATLAGRAKLYRLDGRLVVISSIQVKSESDRQRLKIVDVSPNAFPAYLSTLMVFFKVENETSVNLTGCPAGITRTFLEYHGKSEIPILTKILGSPTLREDFTLVDAPGYDLASGFYLELDGEFFPIPKDLNKEHATGALQRLKMPIRKFPFVDRAAESAVLAMFVTAVVRGCLPSAPLFAVTAPTMGTGKSKLTDMAAILATGDYAQAISYKYEEKEMEKILFSALREGSAVISIDNVDSHLRGAALCTMLTQRTYKSRILGVSETMSVPTIGLYTANGNNLVIRGDLTTRVILSSLDARIERPQERKFEFDPCEFTLKHRKELIRDILTIVLAYRASAEKVRIRPFGRFEAWSEIVREPLVWLGEADPLDTAELVEKSDPVRRDLSEVIHALHVRFGDGRFMAKDCVSIDPTWYHGSIMREKQAALIEALNAAIASPRGVNARTVGNWLAQYENRIESGMKIIQDGEWKKIACWRVVEVGNEDGGGFGSTKPTIDSE